jgi:hypothetical protein
MDIFELSLPVKLKHPYSIISIEKTITLPPFEYVFGIDNHNNNYYVLKEKFLNIIYFLKDVKKKKKL